MILLGGTEENILSALSSFPLENSSGKRFSVKSSQRANASNPNLARARAFAWPRLASLRGQPTRASTKRLPRSHPYNQAGSYLSIVTWEASQVHEQKCRHPPPMDRCLCFARSRIDPVHLASPATIYLDNASAHTAALPSLVSTPPRIWHREALKLCWAPQFCAPLENPSPDEIKRQGLVLCTPPLRSPEPMRALLRVDFAQGLV